MRCAPSLALPRRAGEGCIGWEGMCRMRAEHAFRNYCGTLIPHPYPSSRSCSEFFTSLTPSILRATCVARWRASVLSTAPLS